MKIGIIHSQKVTPWTEYLSNGILKANAEYELFAEMSDVNKVDKCDAIITVAYNTQHFQHVKRAVINRAQTENIPVIYLDAGAFYDRVSHNNDDVRYVTLTINSPKRHGIKYVDTIAEKKWEDLSTDVGLPFGSYQPQGGIFCTILMHNMSGYASMTKSVQDQQKEYVEKCMQIMKDGWQIKTSMHPNAEGVTYDIDTVLRISEVVAGWHTNALCWYRALGMPIICWDDNNFAYDVASHTHVKQQPYSMDEVWEWVNRIAKSQFKYEDINSGKVWEHILPYVETMNKNDLFNVI